MRYFPFKYAWRMGNSDGRTFASLVRQFEKHPDTCDEVWFFVSEPSSYGYHPLEDVARQCEALKPRMAQLRAMGIRAGVNVWPTFGENARNNDISALPPMPYPCMVDRHGVPAKGLACPSSPAFLEYIRQKFKLIAESSPSFIWVDDDCRMMDLNADFPCFCPECVAGFEGGRFSSREELVAALNTPENEALRRAWCGYEAGRLETFCKTVRAAVDEVDPAIETPFMSVGYSHTTYAGDYLQRCADALRANEFRPGHGFYWDDAPRTLFSKTMDIARQVQRMPTGADILMEEESFPSTPLDKAASTRMLEIGASLGVGCNGIAMNHLLDCGGADPLAYLKDELVLMEKHRPMFERFTDFAAGLPCAGIWPIDNEWKLAGMPVDENGWFDENKKGYELDTADRWMTYGVALTANADGAFANLLHGRLVETMTDAEIKALFDKPVIMDTDALDALHRRGLGELAGAVTGESHRGITEYLTDHPVNGNYISYAGGTRFPLFVCSTDILPMEGWDVEVLAENRTPYGEVTGYGTVRLTRGDRPPVVIMGCGPYRFIGTPGRYNMMQNLLLGMGAPLAMTPQNGSYSPGRLTPFIRTDGSRAAVVLINASLDPVQRMDVHIKTSTGSKATLLRPGLPEAVTPSGRVNGGEYLTVTIGKMAPWEMWMLLIE